MDLHHVVEAWVIAVGALGEAEVGSLAAVAGDDVADDHSVAGPCAPNHRCVFLFSAKGGIDLGADPVEVAVDGGSVLTPTDASRAFHRPGVHPGNTDLTEAAPEVGIAKTAQHRLAGPCEVGGRIGGEPHRR